MEDKEEYRSLTVGEIEVISKKLKFEDGQWRLYSDREGHTHQYIVFSKEEVDDLQKGKIKSTKLGKRT